MKMPPLVAVFGAIVLVISTLVFWRDAEVQGRAKPENSALVARGQVLYAQNCASCHGEALQGQPNWRERRPNGRLPAPPHDDTGHTWHHPDEHLFRITRNGLTPPLAPEGYKRDMPSFGSTLTDDDIWSVLSYIQSTWSQRSRAHKARVDEAYRKQAGQE